MSVFGLGGNAGASAGRGDDSAARANWQHNKRRVHAFDTLIARADARAQRTLLQHEQRASDEYAARLSRQRAARPS